jgi:hypothetical protein
VSVEPGALDGSMNQRLGFFSCFDMIVVNPAAALADVGHL